MNTGFNPGDLALCRLMLQLYNTGFQSVDSIAPITNTKSVPYRYSVPVLSTSKARCLYNHATCDMRHATCDMRHATA
jgi:hypothetical protein